MANEIGTAYIGIQPNAKGIEGKIGTAITPGVKTAGTNAGTKMASSMSASLLSTGKRLMGAGAIVTAFSVPLIKGIKGTLQAYEQQMEVETKLTEIYKTRHGATNEQIQDTLKLTSAQQKLGVVGDEVQLAGAQQLATFTKTTGAVDALIPSMNDLLVQQNGLNATQGDAVQIANLMGKVLQGQTGALKRVGISFTDAQEQVLKYGTEEERVAMLSEVINQNVGNMNEAMAGTPLGKIQQAKNAMGDLKESIGEQLAPVVAKLAGWLSSKLVPALEKFIGWMKQHPTVAKLAVAITGIMAVAGPLLLIIGGIVASASALIPVITAISAPVLGIVAGVGALVSVLVLAWKKSDTFREAVKGLGEALKTFLGGAINFLRPILQALWGVLQKVAKVVATVLTPVIRAVSVVLRALGNAFTWVGQKIGPVKEKIESIGKKFQTVKGWIVTAGEKIKSVGETIAKPFTTAWEKIEGAYKKIKGIFPISLGKIFSGIKLPHFKISGGEAPWGIGGFGKRPSIDIEWYKKGGIMNRPTLFGGGEAGAEAIVPLDPFWKRLEKLAGTGDSVTINVYAPEGMDVRALASEVETRLINSTKRRTNAWR